MMMPWIDDLAYLEPHYLSSRFRPLEHGLSRRTVGLALASSSAATQRYLREHTDPRLWDLPAGDEPATSEERFQATLTLVAFYFWEIVYRKHSDVYDRFSAAQQIPLAELFPADAVADRVVADLGTGTGKAVGQVARYARQVIGIDPSEPMLERARARFPEYAHVSFELGDFAHVPLPDDSVDTVVSCYAYQPSEERGGMAGLAEIRRILRPGGVALLAIDNKVTSDFLREQGCELRVADQPVIWRRPPDAECSPLLDRMFEVAGVNFGAGGEVTGSRMHVLSFGVR